MSKRLDAAVRAGWVAARGGFGGCVAGAEGWKGMGVVYGRGVEVPGLRAAEGSARMLERRPKPP